MWHVFGCEVRVFALTGFLCNGPSHTYSQSGKLVEKGGKPCNSLILPGAFDSEEKNSLFFFFAFMGFIWHITIPRLRRWSSQRVKWREGRRTGTQTLPPPSLSPLIRFTSSTSQPLNSALLHSPHHGSPYRDLWGHLYRLSGNTEIGFVLFLLSSLFVFAFFNPAFCAWMIDETPRKVFPGPNQGKGGRVLKTKL